MAINLDNVMARAWPCWYVAGDVNMKAGVKSIYMQYQASAAWQQRGLTGGIFINGHGENGRRNQ